MRVRVDRVRLVRDVGRVLGDGRAAEPVDGRDEGVSRRGGAVARGPEGLAVVGDAAARVGLLLAVVDDGDAWTGMFSILDEIQGHPIKKRYLTIRQHSEGDCLSYMSVAAHQFHVFVLFSLHS